MNVRYLTPRDLIALAALELGDDPKVDEDALYEAVAVPARTEHGQDAFPSIPVKAAVLMTELMRRSPFGGGNARVALLAALVFLNINGLDVAASESDLAELAQLAGRGNLSLMMVAAGFESIVVPLGFPGSDPGDGDEESPDQTRGV